MKNVYYPDEKDIKNWVNNENNGWPASDWDHYVLDSKCDDMIFNYANDNNCNEKDFFIHTLYLLVGIYHNDKNKDRNKFDRIIKLTDRVNKCSSNEIKIWKEKTQDLLSHKIEYDSTFWMHYMFYEDITSRKNEG